MEARIGALDVVGVGINVPMQTTQRTESIIRSADIVYYGQSSSIAEAYIEGLNPNSFSIQRHYHEQPNRHRAYLAMKDEVMSAVAAGKNVALAMYGHPRVFADFPKWCVDETRELGGRAQFHAAVGADSCLVADLEIDPGRNGIQHYEATHLLMYDINIAPTTCLVLWQISLAGDVSIKELHRTKDENIQHLVDKLKRWYPAEHKVCIYEAAIHALDGSRQEWLPLSDLASAELYGFSTLVIPPISKPNWDQQVLDAMGLKAKELGNW
ncbi:SAM-dependent methyltransferase [Ferrimonas aestuarii]|uniref:Tetrapyrrole methylase domain-containing protein n=1 Tax=Ferrimonas aestuarii TaxID=2569539 RepID=A0A4U1BLC1_9GAMM|nr:SAM-dependent methyltransferase [Ferrimonas aestuarii]TKB52769.1 hypothetical protein FCL42_15785 [Ferrimonas aestuarii]